MQISVATLNVVQISVATLNVVQISVATLNVVQISVATLNVVQISVATLHITMLRRNKTHAGNYAQVRMEHDFAVYPGTCCVCREFYVCWVFSFSKEM